MLVIVSLATLISQAKPINLMLFQSIKPYFCDQTQAQSHTFTTKDCKIELNRNLI
jgi:hypothetical protein